MVDTQLQNAQKWLNSTFGSVAGWTHVTEDGSPGQGTVNGFIEGMQNLLGISPVVPSFGPATWSKLSTHGPVKPADGDKWIRIVQGALYAKGYDGGGNSGKWDGSDSNDRTTKSIAALKADIGIGGDGASVPPKVMRALLSTDPAVLAVDTNIGIGIRGGQQWLNKTYGGHDGFYYGSTGGIFDRVTQQNLVRGIQYELGQSDASADGLYGPGTATQLKAATGSVVNVGSSDTSHHWVHLFLAALNFNGYLVPLVNTFTSTQSAKVLQFQRFEGFATSDQTGIGDFRTWAELLVSTGDGSRPGTAFDCASTITAARAQALYSAGYRYAGRYLTNMQPTADVPDPIDKNIKPGELDTIFAAGLSVFPIFEEGNGSAWFTDQQGGIDAERAASAAKDYGFPGGTTIYFAVDFDATDAVINPKPDDNTATTGVVAYFRGVQRALNELGNPYAIGIYGTRNVCAKVSAAGLATKSFIAGLSTGWSGNLGFRLPSNWAFNQIQSLTVGSGAGSIDIDKDVASGRDTGVTSVTTPPEPNAAFFSYLNWLQDRAHEYNQQYNTSSSDNELVCHYMRVPDFVGAKWAFFAGDVNTDFIAWVDAYGVEKQTQIVDPQYRISIDTEHLFGCINGVLWLGEPVSSKTETPDFVGWAGDLLQLLRPLKNLGSKYDNARDFAHAYVNNSDPSLEQSDFGQADVIQDAVGADIGYALLGLRDGTVAGLVYDRFKIDGDWKSRITDLVNGRFGGTRAGIYAAAHDVLTTNDPQLIEIRSQFLNHSLKEIPDPDEIPMADREGLAEGFSDVLAALAGVS